MILPSQNQKYTEKYFKTLPENDESVSFFNGKEYESPSNPLEQFFNMFFKNEQRLKTLLEFYPHQILIKSQHDYYFQMKNDICMYGGIFSLASVFGINQMAKAGYVMPLLKQYGSYFKTHRIFRQYALAIILPQLLLQYNHKRIFYNHIEHCWTIHSKRMNQKIMIDPQNTIYPKESELPFKNY